MFGDSRVFVPQKQMSRGFMAKFREQILLERVSGKMRRINFQRLTDIQDEIVQRAVKFYEKEKSDEAYHSLMTLLDFMVKEADLWYWRMEYDVKMEPLLPEQVDAFIDLALDTRDKTLFAEFSKIKARVIIPVHHA